MSGSETRVENESNKLFRKVVAEPDNFDGNRRKFHNWWKDMQLWLMGYSDLADMPKIIAVLTRLTAGDATEWARAKKTSLLDGATMTWETFKVELVERFDDPSRTMRAQNDIHQCFQERMSAQAYIDKFEVLKSTSALTDSEALFLFRRGINPDMSLAIFNTNQKIPSTYEGFVAMVKDIGRNMEERKGILAGARSLYSSPPSRPAPRHTALDRRTGTGLTYGGSGQPMEIGQTRPVKCYNCNKTGHMARECKEPKREKGACFYCAKQGHQAKDCLKKKRDFRAKSTQVKKLDEEEPIEEEEDIGQADEVPDEDMADFIEGSD